MGKLTNLVGVDQIIIYLVTNIPDGSRPDEKDADSDAATNTSSKKPELTSSVIYHPSMASVRERVALEKYPYITGQVVYDAMYLYSLTYDRRIQFFFNKSVFKEYILNGMNYTGEISTIDYTTNILDNIELRNRIYQNVNENVKTMINTLFPTSYPATGNNLISFDQYIKHDDPSFLSSLYTSAIGNVLPSAISSLMPSLSSYTSYVKIDGQQYTVFRSIWLNDFINCPPFKELMEKFNNFNIWKNKTVGTIENSKKKYLLNVFTIIKSKLLGSDNVIQHNNVKKKNLTSFTYCNDLRKKFDTLKTEFGKLAEIDKEESKELESLRAKKNIDLAVYNNKYADITSANKTGIKTEIKTEIDEEQRLFNLKNYNIDKNISIRENRKNIFNAFESTYIKDHEKYKLAEKNFLYETSRMNLCEKIVIDPQYSEILSLLINDELEKLAKLYSPEVKDSREYESNKIKNEMVINLINAIIKLITITKKTDNKYDSTILPSLIEIDELLKKNSSLSHGIIIPTILKKELTNITKYGAIINDIDTIKDKYFGSNINTDFETDTPEITEIMKKDYKEYRDFVSKINNLDNPNYITTNSILHDLIKRYINKQNSNYYIIKKASKNEPDTPISFSHFLKYINETYYTQRQDINEYIKEKYYTDYTDVPSNLQNNGFKENIHDHNITYHIIQKPYNGELAVKQELQQLLEVNALYKENPNREPKYSTYVALDLIKGELNDTNRKALNCDYQNDKLGSLFDNARHIKQHNPYKLYQPPLYDVSKFVLKGQPITAQKAITNSGNPAQKAITNSGNPAQKAITDRGNHAQKAITNSGNPAQKAITDRDLMKNIKPKFNTVGGRKTRRKQRKTKDKRRRRTRRFQ